MAKSTEKGFVISHESGNRYLSKSGLEMDSLALLKQHMTP